MQRSAQTADRHEQLREIRVLAQQFGKLVDDDEECRQWREGRTGGAGALILGDIRKIARGAQQLLTPVHLAGQRVLHAGHQVCLFGEVGDDGRDMLRTVQSEERRTTLEVDEHQVERIRRMGGDHAERQGAQELRFARTGRTDAEPVRAHAVLRGFLDIQFHRSAVHRDADRHPQPVAANSIAPHHLRVEQPRVADSHDVGPARTDLGLDLNLITAAGQNSVGRQPPRTRHRLGDGEVIGMRKDLGPDIALGAEATFGQLQLHAATGGQGIHPGTDLDEGHRIDAVVHDEAFGTDQGATVDDDEDLRPIGRGLRGAGEPFTLGDQRRQRLLDLAQRVVNQSGCSDPVEGARMLRVRKPFEPVPVRCCMPVDHRRDQELVGPVEHRELTDHGTQHASRNFWGSVDGDGGKTPQVQRDRQLRNQRVSAYESPQRDGCDRFQLLDGSDLGRHQLGGESLITGSDAHMAVVTIAGAPLPHPPATSQRPERGRVRVVP
ncbi:Uncharacterised protein [Mycobacteroides abscessus subsp. abscessus]|nr:Uncharacterised protein [Mycobacteroides abscessus subsp. abscessus]